jgi:hypothetical protein
VVDKVRADAAEADRQFEERLVKDPRFRQRIAKAREHLRAGLGIKLEDLADER